MEYAIIEYIVLFFVYGFLGWCAEVCYAAASHGRFVNRGFLMGPVCPIYGIGMVLIIAVLEPLKDDILLLFAGSVVITTLLELFVGLLAEKCLDQRLWDYSDEPFNIKGLICPLFSILWGAGALVIVSVINPAIIKLIRFVPETALWIAAAALGACILTDTVLSVMEAAKIPRRKKAALEIERILTELSGGIGENISDKAIRIYDEREKVEKYRNEARKKLEFYRRCLDDRKSRVSARFVRAFPYLEKSGYRRKIEEAHRRCDDFLKKHGDGRK